MFNVNISIRLPAREAALIVVLPAGTHLKKEGSKIKADDAVIEFR